MRIEHKNGNFAILCLFLTLAEFKKGFRIDFNKLHEEGDKLLKKLNVNRSSRELVENLSLGEQQMVEIAKALSLDAKIIIMDEPTDALTETETESLFKVIDILILLLL